MTIEYYVDDQRYECYRQYSDFQRTPEKGELMTVYANPIIPQITFVMSDLWNNCGLAMVGGVLSVVFGLVDKKQKKKAAQNEQQKCMNF